MEKRDFYSRMEGVQVYIGILLSATTVIILHCPSKSEITNNPSFLFCLKIISRA